MSENIAAQVGAALGLERPEGAAMRPAIVRLQALLPAPGDPADEAALLAQLRCLHAVGRRDLPMGRLFEGHVDALQIVARNAGAARAAALVAERAALGVWNADLPGEALRLSGGGPADGRLSGAKSFASGAGVLTHALVTADVAGGRQLVLIDLARTPPAIDRGWWNTIGMRRSETHLVRWHEAAIAPDQLVGPPDGYAREPWFSGGALRFVAVQAGGVAALFDHVRDHLVATERARDPHQAVRLAALFAHAETAAGAVRAAATAWFAADDPVRLARVAAARIQVADAAEQALAAAQQAVGLQGLFAAHPLAAAVTDLMVYLRQPAPDAQRMRVGAAIADGALVPAL